MTELEDPGNKQNGSGDAASPPPEPSEPSPEPATPKGARIAVDPLPVPEPNEAGEHDLQLPRYFLNRELTWLRFNFRVLHEAEDPRTPILERLKFVAIVSSNIDEFFMKRIGGLKQQVGAGVHTITVDGRTPQLQIDEAIDMVRRLEQRKRAALIALMDELGEHGVSVSACTELDDEHRAYLRDYYVENIYPLVTPQAIDPAHPFPFISNLSLNLLVTLSYEDDDIPSLARVKIPVGGGVPRYLKLPGENTFVPMESIIADNLDLLFPGMQIHSCERFRVTRNANTERSEDRADDLLALIETELRDRRFAPIVRLEITAAMSLPHRGMLAAELGLDEQADVVEVGGVMGMRDLMELMVLKDAEKFHGVEFQDPTHHPIDNPELTPDRNIFHVIRDRGSILLQHPYESFTTSVERFLREASSDPKVRAIKMTLYRTSAGTKVIDYLIDAAENGKQVAVVVELKARFDEKANIRWASRLENAGIHVTYGVVGLKTHCKVILVVRQDHSGIRRYAHIGTGNYHAGTARLYTDLGMLTSDETIGRDATELFNYLTTGYKPKRNYDKILTAPKGLKKAILGMIQREIDVHTPEDPGQIIFKINALEDADVTRALYRATQAGVRVDLIVRDTCRLRPGIPGLSETAKVFSVVGRFLEHARVLYFRNGGEDQIYIGSADCMKRNLESRVEVFAPVEDPAHRREVLSILDAQRNDARNAWDMEPDATYVQRMPSGDDNATGSQQLLIERAERRRKAVSRLKRRKTRMKPGHH